MPPQLNCALITSGLATDEISLRDSMTSFPAFDMTERVGSHEIFELLFRNLDRNYGLVDSDCFVMNGSWFADSMAGLRPGVAINGALSYGPIPLAPPPFIAINPAAKPEIERAIGGRISPAAYAYTGPGSGPEIDGALVQLIEDHHVAALAGVLGMEGPQLPFPQGGLMDVLDDGREVRSHERFYHRQSGRSVARVVFDGMMLYQLMALAAGWRIGHFRSYPGTKVFAPEVVHAGGISYWERVPASNLSAAAGLPWAAHIDAILLDSFVRQFGASGVYAARADRLTASLQQFGVTVPVLQRQLEGKLSSAGVGVSDDRWRAILSQP